MPRASIHLSQKESHLKDCNVSLHLARTHTPGGQLHRGGRMANGAAAPPEAAASPANSTVADAQLLGTERPVRCGSRVHLPWPRRPIAQRMQSVLCRHAHVLIASLAYFTNLFPRIKENFRPKPPKNQASASPRVSRAKAHTPRVTVGPNVLIDVAAVRRLSAAPLRAPRSKATVGVPARRSGSAPSSFCVLCACAVDSACGGANGR